MSSAEHLEAGRAGAGAADGHVACSMTSTRLRRLRHTHGQAALDSILELAGGVRSPDELEDVGTRQLTELLGHRAFHEALAEAVDDESRDPVTLALIDIDDFKQSNDDHGGIRLATRPSRAWRTRSGRPSATPTVCSAWR
jgi:hypothetical protein